MTAIVAMEIHQQPFLIADLLLSGLEQEESFRLPTVGDMRNVFPEGSGFTPVELRQKIAVISDYLMVAWSGSYLGARIVLGELKQHFGARLVSSVDLQMFQEVHAQLFAELGVDLVGFGYDGKGFTRFASGGDRLACQPFGEVTLLGSGAEHFRRVLSIERVLCPRAAEMSDFEHGIASLLGMVGSNTARETLEDGGLPEYFGGGYEIGVWEGGRFQKLDSILYLAFFADAFDDGADIGLLGAMRLAYHNDLLLIRSLSGDAEGETLTPRIDNLLVQPTCRNVTPSELLDLKVPPFDARFICCSFLVESEREGLAQRNIVTMLQMGDDDGRGHLVHMVKEGRRVEIRFSDEFWDYVQENIQAAMKSASSV